MQQGSVCHIKGRLSQVEVSALWLQRHSLLAENIDVIDLSDLVYSDSAGIAFILELMSLVKAKKRVLSFISPSEQISKLIDLYDLECFFIEEARQGK